MTGLAIAGVSMAQFGLPPFDLPPFDLPPLGISIPVANPRDPAYQVSPGQGYDGVALILLPGGDNCTGSLLTSGRHLLTAAHCFEEESQDGQPTRSPDLSEIQVVFRLPQRELRLDPIRIEIHPDWDDLDGFNGDLAIIHLAKALPQSVPRYELYRDSDELGQVFTRLGYGVMATGAQGEFGEDESMVLRRGQNRYEALGELYNEVDGDPESYIQPGQQLLYDYDSGRPENDALGIEYGLNNLGLGAQEIGSSGGDSGGPAFIDGKVAGISSSGGSPDLDGIDVTPENDTSFGEYFFDTRVSAYADYIDQVVGGTTTLGQVGGSGETLASLGAGETESDVGATIGGVGGWLGLSLSLLLVVLGVLKRRSQTQQSQASSSPPLPSSEESARLN